MADRRPCRNDHRELAPETCQVCALIVRNPRLAAAWKVAVPSKLLRSPFPPAKQAKARTAEVPSQPLYSPPHPACRELGCEVSKLELEQIGIDPATCGCQKKVRLCALHEHCTTATPRDGLACCAECLDYDNGKPEPITRPRHLLYHLWPVQGDGVWQTNVAELRQRLHLFDGRRAIAIVTSDNADSLETVQAAFAGERIDSWREFPNDPKLREVVTWDWLWEQVAHLSGATFYAHAKGVTRPWDAGSSIPRWVRLMYRSLLDEPDLIEAMLKRWPLVGTAKKLGAGFPGSASAWHYSGTFYWVRNDALGQKWRTIDRTWYGNEAWPGLHWKAEEAGAMAVGRVAELDLYRLDVMSRVEKEFEQWKSRQLARRSVTG